MSLTDVLTRTNGDIRAVMAYFKREVEVPICTKSTLQICKNMLKNREEDEVTRAAAFILCIKKFLTYRQNDRFWNTASDEVSSLLVQCFNYLTSDINRNISVLNIFCLIVVKLCQKSDVTSSLFFKKCSGLMLDLLLRKDLRSDVFSGILNALNAAGQRSDATTVYIVHKKLKVRLQDLAKIIFRIPVDDQKVIFSILMKFAKETGEAQLKALLWFPEYPDLQLAFVESHDMSFTEGSTHFMKILCRFLSVESSFNVRGKGSNSTGNLSLDTLPHIREQSYAGCRNQVSDIKAIKIKRSKIPPINSRNFASSVNGEGCSKKREVSSDFQYDSFLEKKKKYVCNKTSVNRAPDSPEIIVLDSKSSQLSCFSSVPSINVELLGDFDVNKDELNSIKISDSEEIRYAHYEILLPNSPVPALI